MTETAGNSVEMIQALLRSNQFGEAEVAAANLARENPGPKSAILEAQVMGQTRGVEVAVVALKAAAEKFPDNLDVQNVLARFCMAARRFDEAAGAFGRLVTAQPEDGNLAYAQALALAQGSVPRASLPIFEKLIRAKPEMPELHYNHGLALKANGLTDDAERAYREAVRLDPELFPAWGNLANLLIDLGRVAEAFEVFQTRLEKHRARGIAEDDPEFSTACGAKLRHDLEQLRHLDDIGKLDAADQGLIEAYGAVLEDLGASIEDRVQLTRLQLESMGGTYQRILRLEPGERIDGDVINPDIDRAAIEAAYRSEGQEIAILDDVLTAPALERLRSFLNDSSIWHQWRFTDGSGFLQARMADGLSCPLILQIAEAFRSAFPTIFKDHTLRMVWAFKHSERIKGVPVHADFAAVNVTLAITPDEANLDPESGGLLVWPVKSPTGGDIARHNPDPGVMERLVAESGAPAVRTAHRQNRAMMFNGDYAYKTDDLHFKPGYLNRHMNLTMLFGRRDGK